MRELTPLERLSGLDAPLRARLAGYWITSVEEFISTARATNEQYGSGRAALAVALGVGEDRIRALVEAAMPLLPAGVSFSVPIELDVGDGLFLDNYQDIEAAAFGPPPDLPPTVEPLGPLPPAVSQGVRNTCVAFTLVACYQALSKDPTDLSEQFLYFICKSRDKIPGDVGTDPLLAMRVLQEVGVCTEAAWPYRPAPSDSANPGLGPAPAAAAAEAAARRIVRFQQLPAKDFRQIKAALAAGKPVLIGLPIWEHWQGAWQAQTRGRLRAALPGERRKGGHAMCALGYRDDPAAPGGGYFIVRNSWGAEWASENPDGPGYCHVPYKVIFEQGLAAIAAEGVAAARAPAATAGAATGAATGATAPAPTARPAAPAQGKPAPRARSLGAAAVDLGDVRAELRALRVELQRELRAIRGDIQALRPPSPAAPGHQPNGGGAMPTPDLPPEEVRAIFEDAKRLRDQLDALIGRLSPLLDAAPATPAPAPAPAPTIAATPAPAAVTPAPDVAPEPAKSAVTGPLVIVAGDRDQLVTPLGLSLDGRPLLELDAAGAAALAKNQLSAESKDRINLYKAKSDARAAHLGVVADISAANLEQARWAVVVNALEDSALIEAVWPLIAHRMEQMKLSPPQVSFTKGESAGDWLARHSNGGTQNLKDHWGQIPPVLTYRPGEQSRTWLARYGVASGPVDPRRGVPFYLLILGRPGPLAPGDEAFIPMIFQYLLDVFWGVGRLCFSDAKGAHRLADYTAYAQQLVAFEQAQDAKERLLKEVVYFSTRHEADIATNRSTDELALPLTRWHQDPEKIPARLGFGMRSLIEAEATRSALGGVLTGSGQGKPPAILFTASHGLGLPLADPRLTTHQGALITQDWSGIGPVKREHWLAGEDLGADLKVGGMFAFLFACYGAGCPDLDEFVFDPLVGPERGRPQVAPFPLIAQLPQRLLAGGALGVIGHVDRAWTYSFSGTESRVKGQSQPFEDVLGRLLQGKRAGDATDEFNVIQGDRALALTEELENIRFGKRVEDLDLAVLWMARNDARNYALLGDPAARLPFGDGA
jgi:hypothetical protein